MDFIGSVSNSMGFMRSAKQINQYQSERLQPPIQPPQETPPPPQLSNIIPEVTQLPINIVQQPVPQAPQRVQRNRTNLTNNRNSGASSREPILTNDFNGVPLSVYNDI